MATYKKRGYKPKTKAEKEVQLEDGSTTAEVFKSLDEGASKTEAWVEKNQKAILGVVGIVAIAVLGYILYQKFYQEPQNIEASNEMYQSQSYYEQALNSTTEKDSLFNLALNGGAGKYGFIDIADKYSGTAAGNMANFYAGMAYLNLKDYQSAINHLDSYDGGDEMSGPIAKGGIGDAFIQLNQPEEALKYYVEAANMRNNAVTTPRFLLKAGVTALTLNRSEEALGYFNRIVEEYKDAPEAANAKVYKGQAEAMQ
ncbi:MAG: tetratricopeptide repeat protein [Flavobacteriaceae bacterium]|nr:tetratricopeptide repeat protein [Flavobacteriaceae bacterium]